MGGDVSLSRMDKARDGRLSGALGVLLGGLSFGGAVGAYWGLTGFAGLIGFAGLAGFDFPDWSDFSGAACLAGGCLAAFDDCRPDREDPDFTGIGIAA